MFITGTVLGDHPTRKLAGHASGKVHQYCETKYMSSKTDVPRKVKRTVVDMLRTSVDTKKNRKMKETDSMCVILRRFCILLSTSARQLTVLVPLLDFIIEIGSPNVTAYIDAQPEKPEIHIGFNGQ